MAPPIESSPAEDDHGKSLQPYLGQRRGHAGDAAQQDAADDPDDARDDPNKRVDRGRFDAQAAGDLLILGGGPHGQPDLGEAEDEHQDGHDDHGDDEPEERRWRHGHRADVAG